MSGSRVDVENKDFEKVFVKNTDTLNSVRSGWKCELKMFKTSL